MAKVLMKGNEAIAKAAILGGCRFYAGYPITPQNEVPEYLSREMAKAGGTFVQAESEVAAINMVYGAGACGMRAMTSSSSPGIALKQEGIGYCTRARIPAVIVNIVRGGPGLGGIQPSQQDYYMCVKGGANGDYKNIVLAPATVQETVDDVKNAFEMSLYYRIPVIILADGLIGQMMEPVDFDKPAQKRHTAPLSYWALGSGGIKHEIWNFSSNQYDLERDVLEDFKVYEAIEKKEAAWDETYMNDAEYAIVAYGTASRICRQAIKTLRSKGLKVGLIKPRTLWPFPYEAFKKYNSRIKKYINVELSMGQMIDDTRLAANDYDKVVFLGRTAGVIITPEEIIEFTKKLMGVRE